MSENNYPEGIYEEIITLGSSPELAALEEKGDYTPSISEVSDDESELLLRKHLTGVLGQGVRHIESKTKDKAKRLSAFNALISSIETASGTSADCQFITPLQKLSAITKGKNKIVPMRPRTSLLTADLFTGTSHLSVAEEIRREIISSDKVDLLVSFIKQSGLNLIWDSLVELTRSRPLRIITTSYMGATDPEALRRLASLPNTEIKVSYDTTRTRLHAKAYLFTRHNGYSTAFIGSSNMSSAAIGNGLEWNVKISQKETPHIIETASIAFETYWEDSDFHLYDSDKFQAAIESQISLVQSSSGWMFDITPYPFQQTILDQLEAERTIHHRYKNLIVAATGTGKTVMAAFDFARFYAQNPNARLLFIAHRKEILTQARDCFRTVLKDQKFGDLGIDGQIPTNSKHLFMSIQTLNAKRFIETVPNDTFDFVIIDEFHHAKAPSYQALLAFIKPEILLGLTGTPERMDGTSVQDLFFDGIISAEVRLPEAINRQLLAPFQYCCVDDGTDLRSVKFARGRYDDAELENIFTFNDSRVIAIRKALYNYLPNPNSVKALGFCVSVSHAEYMARKFNEAGLKSAVVHGKTPSELRESLPNKLARGEINYLFSVDVFNEGVDIPQVDTILFLRPTESLTVFLQQLGRGLRLSEGKELLTVLDFIGQAHEKYSFEAKFRSLLGRTTRSIKSQIEQDNYALPFGCSIILEEVAQETILRNIKSAIQNVSFLRRRLNTYLQNDANPSLGRFMEMYPDTDLSKLYNKKNSFSDMCAQVQNKSTESAVGLTERAKFIAGLYKMNSFALLDYARHLFGKKAHSVSAETEPFYKAMLYYSCHQDCPTKTGDETFEQWLSNLVSNSDFCAEVADLCRIKIEQINFSQPSPELGYTHGLNLHCSYSRFEIMAALGVWNEKQSPETREGVKYVTEINTDIFFITLNKDDKDFVESQRYEDYAISPSIFHWQSQSTTSELSPTGQRYIHHIERNTRILLFIRTDKNARYVFAGQASYMNHSGSNPMSIQWHLDTPLPEFLLEPAMAVGVG